MERKEGGKERLKGRFYLLFVCLFIYFLLRIKSPNLSYLCNAQLSRNVQSVSGRKTKPECWQINRCQNQPLILHLKKIASVLSPSLPIPIRTFLGSVSIGWKFASSNQKRYPNPVSCWRRVINMGYLGSFLKRVISRRNPSVVALRIVGWFPRLWKP